MFRTRRSTRFTFGVPPALVLLPPICVLAGCGLVAEARSTLSFARSPLSARGEHSVRLWRRGSASCSLTMVGTIHSGHLDTPEFTLWDLASAMTHVRPDLVLVELTPDAVAVGEWGMGPVEMAYIALTARERGLAVRGVDWFVPAGTSWWATHWRSTSAREDSIAGRVNAEVCNDPLLHRGMLFIGYAHVRPLVERLKQRGWEQRAEADDLRASLFDSRPEDAPIRYPAGMRQSIQARIARDSSQLARDSLAVLGAWRDGIHGNLTIRRRLLADMQAASGSP